MATPYYNSNNQPVKPKILLLVLRRCSREQDTYPGLLGVRTKSQSRKSGNYLSPETGDPGGPRWGGCEWPVHSARVNGPNFPSPNRQVRLDVQLLPGVISTVCSFNS